MEGSVVGLPPSGRPPPDVASGPAFFWLAPPQHRAATTDSITVHKIRAAAFIGILGGVLGGCEQWKAPDRIRALEARVDELSAEVSAMSGKPVGTGKDKERAKADGKEDGEDEDKDKDKGEGEGEAKDKGDVAADDHGKDEAGKDADAEHETDGDVAVADKADKEDKAGDEDAKADEGDERKAEPATPKSAKAELQKLADETAPPPHWAYTGADGPSEWGSLSAKYAACGKGHAQSPIDLPMQPPKASAISFDYKPTAATVVDNGHTLQVNLAPGSKISIGDRAYDLVQFHFHTPSEHTLGGERYPLEVHLVHKTADGELAVIGVLYDVGDGGAALAPVWKKWPKRIGAAEKLKKPFDPTVLLPESRAAYRYTGSLTTPPCTEGVTWNVMRRTKTLGSALISAFKAHYPANSRPVQKLGGREVE